MAKQIGYNAAEAVAHSEQSDPYTRPAFTFGNRLRRSMWNICWILLYRFSPRLLHAWRALLLRAFGATLGPHCHFYPKSKVWAPWNLVCADHVCAGDDAEIYNPVPIHLDSHVIMLDDYLAIRPEKRDEVVSLGLKSILSGTLTTCLLGAIVGVVS